MKKLVNLYNVSIIYVLFLWWFFCGRRLCLYKGRVIKFFYLSNFDEEINCCVNVKFWVCR